MRRSMILSALTAALLAGTTSAQAEDVILTAVPHQTTAFAEVYNPFNQTSDVRSVRDFMFEQLVVFNRMQGGKPEYRLAESFDYSEDLTSVTFKIRDGVKWSDGETLDANDVYFTFNLIKEHPALDTRAIWDKLDSVELIDDHHVKVNYKEASTGLIFDVARLNTVPEHIWADVEDPVSFTNPNPVGSGPLTEIRRFTPQEYVQCRNPHYFQADDLDIDCMRFPQIATNDQTLTAAAKGELDWFGSFLPDIEKTYVAKDPENHKYWFPGGSLVIFNLNLNASEEGNKEAFNDVNFRRAFSMSMDRQAMVDIAGYGYPTINKYPSGLGRGYHAWNNPEADAQYGQYTEYNVEAAAALLDGAGYKDVDGDGFLDTPSGKPIQFDLIVPNGWTDWVNTVQLAVEGLNEAGINASVSTPEAANWTQQLLDGSYQAAINALVVGVTPHMAFDTFHSSKAMTSRFSVTGYTNERLDELLDGFFKTADADEQREIMDEIQMILSKDMPHIPVFNNPYWYQYNTARFEGFFSAENDYAVPTVHDGNPERILHLLSIKPKS
ncbi:ABC transporter substrate-binding protein [Maritalea mediterranea]|uniref:ABC transporter substrate-binding protein n=1 Tax=Maritalea mediterranea TaxID=2909667 RepID=A0ABS9EAS4_9HYPH|nr:ABC transporter substrate-binding protein [Maritalea mediterranea]MCF4099292.1 ABC transporter substrate-binding protein [Maritalea mediterranea]